MGKNKQPEPEPQKIMRTLGENLSISVSEAEKKYRNKKGPDDVKEINKEKLKCTVCTKSVADIVKKGAEPFVHMVLGVLVCKDCSSFYGDGYFSVDEDGDDKYCRWCGQGGTLYLCSTCSCAFCKKCIKQNLGRQDVKDLDSDDWQCFICNPQPLFECRTICWALQEHAAKFKSENPATEEEKPSSTTKSKRDRGSKSKKDETTPEVTTSRKRKASEVEEDNESESKKDRKRRKSSEVSRESKPQKSTDTPTTPSRKSRSHTSKEETEDEVTTSSKSETRPKRGRTSQTEEETTPSKKSSRTSKKAEEKNKPEEIVLSDDDEVEESAKKSTRRGSSSKSVKHSKKDNASKKSSAETIIPTENEERSSRRKRSSVPDKSATDSKTFETPPKKSSETPKSSAKKGSKAKEKVAEDTSSVKRSQRANKGKHSYRDESDVSSKKSDSIVDDNSTSESEKKAKRKGGSSKLTKSGKTQLGISKHADDNVIVGGEYVNAAVKDVMDLTILISSHCERLCSKNVQTNDDVLGAFGKLKELMGGVTSNLEMIEKGLDHKIKKWKGESEPDVPEKDKEAEPKETPKDKQVEQVEKDEEPCVGFDSEQEVEDEMKPMLDNNKEIDSKTETVEHVENMEVEEGSEEQLSKKDDEAMDVDSVSGNKLITETSNIELQEKQDLKPEIVEDEKDITLDEKDPVEDDNIKQVSSEKESKKPCESDIEEKDPDEKEKSEKDSEEDKESEEDKVSDEEKVSEDKVSEEDKKLSNSEVKQTADTETVLEAKGNSDRENKEESTEKCEGETELNECEGETEMNECEEEAEMNECEEEPERISSDKNNDSLDGINTNGEYQEEEEQNDKSISEPINFNKIESDDLKNDVTSKMDNTVVEKDKLDEEENEIVDGSVISDSVNVDKTDSVDTISRQSIGIKAGDSQNNGVTDFSLIGLDKEEVLDKVFSDDQSVDKRENEETAAAENSVVAVECESIEESSKSTEEPTKHVTSAKEIKETTEDSKNGITEDSKVHKIREEEHKKEKDSIDIKSSEKGLEKREEIKFSKTPTDEHKSGSGSHQSDSSRRPSGGYSHQQSRWSGDRDRGRDRDRNQHRYQGSDRWSPGSRGSSWNRYDDRRPNRGGWGWNR